MTRYIQGSDRSQVTLLPECLDDFIAQDNPVRVVDAFIGELDMVAMGFEGATPTMRTRCRRLSGSFMEPQPQKSFRCPEADTCGDPLLVGGRNRCRGSLRAA